MKEKKPGYVLAARAASTVVMTPPAGYTAFESVAIVGESGLSFPVLIVYY